MAARIRMRVHAATAVITGVGFFIALLFAWGRNSIRCGEDCYGSPPLDRFGSVTYEPGHHWTRYSGSWQWGAQVHLLELGVAATAVALAVSKLSQRSPLPVYVVALLLLTAWGLWMVLSPGRRA